MPAPKQDLGWQYKMYKGKKVKPVFYAGKLKGKRGIIAAIDEDGEVIKDSNDKPIPYKAL